MAKKLAKIVTPLGAVTSSLLPLSALAQVNVPNSPITSVNAIIGPTGLLCKFFGILFAVLIILAVIFVIVAAFKYLTAAGDPEKVKSANHQLIYAAVAVVVALIARGVPLIVGSFIGTSGGFGGC